MDIEHPTTTSRKGLSFDQALLVAYAYNRVLQRAAALAAINAVSNSSSIYASYMYPKSAGPRYSKLHPLPY